MASLIIHVLKEMEYDKVWMDKSINCERIKCNFFFGLINYSQAKTKKE